MFNMVFVGNANVGKTTWFNFLSGSQYKVANYNGVSVDVSECSVEYKGQLIRFVDLPGLYDLHLASGEEVYAKQFLKNEKIDLLVNVIDIRDIKAGMHLCAQLKKLKIPMVVLLNYVNNKVKESDIEALSKVIHTPILYPSMKERNKILDILLQSPSFYQECMFDERDVDTLSIVSQKTYALDDVLLHPVYGIFILAIFLISSIYFLFTASEPISACIEMIGEYVREYILNLCSEVFILNKIVDALMYSLTTFLSFLPFLILVFLWMSWIEESGYMARISYLLDPYLHFFHLSGNIVIPLLIGYGCSVPAIISTRMIKNEKERKICALMIPFMSCSGKIPIYLLFISTFFKGIEPLVFIVLYGMSFLISLFIGNVCAFKGPKNNFIVELPSYTWPKFKTLYEKVKLEIVHFIKKIWKIMLLTTFLSVLILPYINMNPLMKLFSCLGFTQSYDVTASLPFTLLSKENLVAYFSMNKIEIATLWKSNISLMALCYLVYVALSIPCVMSLSAIKNEFGLRFLCMSILLMLLISFLVCFVLYHSVLLCYFFLG